MSLIETPKKKQGYVYAFTNPSMPGKVKMGFSDDPRARRKQLYTTGVPDPFDVCCVVKVSDMRKAENLVHLIHHNSRHNEQREFFDLRTDAAIETLKLLGDDVTEKFSTEEFPSSRNGKRRKTRKKAQLERNLFKLGFREGDVLQYRRDSEVTAVVATRNKLLFEGEHLSISEAGLRAHNAYAKNSKHQERGTINGWDEWNFNGVSLSEWRIAKRTKRPH